MLWRIKVRWQWPPVFVHFSNTTFLVISSDKSESTNQRTNKIRICYLMISTVLAQLNFFCLWYVCFEFWHVFIAKKIITKQINCHFSRENCYQTCYASQDFPQNINFSSLKFLYHRLANKKELILSKKKLLQNFEGHCHCHSKNITSWATYNLSKYAE